MEKLDNFELINSFINKEITWKKLISKLKKVVGPEFDYNVFHQWICQSKLYDNLADAVELELLSTKKISWFTLNNQNEKIPFDKTKYFWDSVLKVHSVVEYEKLKYLVETEPRSELSRMYLDGEWPRLFTYLKFNPKLLEPTIHKQHMMTYFISKPIFNELVQAHKKTLNKNINLDVLVKIVSEVVNTKTYRATTEQDKLHLSWLISNELIEETITYETTKQPMTEEEFMEFMTMVGVNVYE